MATSADGAAIARAWSIRAALGPWDIKMPPVRKHMVAGHLVPALGSTRRFFSQKHRRVALEILSPGGAAMVTHAWNPDNETLQEKDQAVVRFFRYSKKKNGDHHETDDEDGMYS